MRDPIWKRSGFTPAVLALVALLLRWLVDGASPTSDRILEVVAMWLALVTYQTVRPTVRAKDAEAYRDEVTRLKRANDILTKYAPPTETTP